MRKKQITSEEILFIRLYFDRHIAARLAYDLRARGFDVLRTEEVRMDRASDEEQLTIATEQRRAILTFNIRHFVQLHQEWLNQGKMHGGIIVSRQMGYQQYRELLRRMLRLLDEMTADEIAGQLVHLAQFK